MKYLVFVCITLLVVSAGAALAEYSTQWMSGYYGPQDSNVVSLWHMDEDAGDSPDVLDATHMFNHWYDPAHASGVFGNSMPFNGSNDWARNEPWDGRLNATTGGFTVEMWINPARSQGGYASLADNAAGWLLRYSGDTDGLQAIMWFQNGGATAIMDTPANVVTPGVWQHVALTYGGANDRRIRIYVNGSVAAEQAQEWMIDPNQTEGRVNFGCNKGGGYFWAGAMDEVRISKVARTFSPVRLGPVGDWKSLPDGASIFASDRQVSAIFPADGFFYVEEIDRSAGIRIVSSKPVVVGDVLSINGTLGTNSDGERLVTADAAEVTVLGHNSTLIQPVGASGSSIGSSVGVDACGLLVKLWGIVGYVGPDYYYVDDGSGIEDGSGHLGIRIRADSGELPFSGEFVTIQGVLSKLGGKPVMLQ
ncbi:MAG: LamG domain-containing protein [Armatimonadetes bacterium]|nr:LamG domain-containing protein [Armatimonadota bacterium]